MFEWAYKAGFTLLILQGIALPLLLPLSGWVWRNRLRRAQRLRAATPSGATPQVDSSRFGLLLGSRPMRGAFVAMALLQPVLFLVTVIGSNMYPDTAFDRTLERLGPVAGMLAGGSVLLGFVIWMILFLRLASLSRAMSVGSGSVGGSDAIGEFAGTVFMSLAVLMTGVLILVVYHLATN